MTIRNVGAYLKSLWDWGLLNGCFGSTRIKPTDIDGMVERNGQFLILEGKPGTNGAALDCRPIGDGQRILFDALQKTGLFTVLVIWGDAAHFKVGLCLENVAGVHVEASDTAPVVVAMQIWPHERIPADLDAVRRFVASWFEWANGPQS